MAQGSHSHIPVAKLRLYVAGNPCLTLNTNHHVPVEKVWFYVSTRPRIRILGLAEIALAHLA